MKKPSLIPFLDSRAGFYLDFLSAAEASNDVATDFYPFRILDDSDPVARMIQADLCAGSGEIIKSLFVLVQRDHYLLPRDSLSAMANPDVEEAWRQAASFYRSQPGGGAATLTGPAGGESGEVEPFEPIFFCGRKRLFFRPVCPRCGRPLELCTDDGRLTDAGLAPFSRSLARYLSCSSEGCAGQPDFYVYERLPGDSPRVKDRRDLVKGYAAMSEAAAAASGLPCIGCDERRECFGDASSMRALERITPFSFYPFYMLVFDAMTADVLHFSALLSGAGMGRTALRLRTEQAYGQADWLEKCEGLSKSGFLFADDPRFFAEVLYLKLSLLSEIVRVTPGEGFPPEPGFRIAPERIWVKATEQNSLLPSLWTFTVRPLDIFRSFSGSRKASKLISRSDPYYLAIIWFSVLTANERRSVADISRDIRESIINDALASDFPSDRSPGNKPPFGAFPPSDIFWSQSDDAQALISRTSYLEFWGRAMDLGKTLMAAAVDDDRAWSREDFLKSVDALRDEIREELFSSALPADEHREAVRANDGEVRAVLNDIISELRVKAKQERVPEAPPAEAAPPPVASVDEEEEESLETIIIGPAHTQVAAAPAAVPVSDDLAETVIISSKRPSEATAPAAPPPKEPAEEALEETLIIGSGASVSTPRGETAEVKQDKPPQRTEADEMEETVIIPSSGARNQFIPPAPAEGLGEELLEETVIISRRTGAAIPEPQASPKQEPPKTAEDDLEATLIITRPKPGPGEKS